MLTEKTIDILLYLSSHENVFIRKLSTNLNITYVHVFKMVDILKKKKLVKCNKTGRKMNIFLTKKGLKVALKFYELKKLLK